MHVVPTTGGGGGGPGLPEPQVRSTMAWLASLVTNPEVRRDVAAWRENMPRVPGDEPPTRDRIAEKITKVAPTAAVCAY